MNPEEPIFRYSCPIQVRFTDIDLMSHVTNSVHLAYCDIARLEYFSQVLGEQIDYKTESLVIASITIDYLKPIFYYEKIEVLTKTNKIGNKSIQTLQHIINSETREIKSVLKAAIAGFNYIEQKSIAIPERWKNRLIEFDKDVEYKYQ
jgi:acyl-CoA thioester hydrolase